MQFFSGPEYTYEQHRVGRIAQTILLILFLPIAFGISYAVGAIIGNSIAPAAFGIIGTAFFVALNLPVFFVQRLWSFRS